MVQPIGSFGSPKDSSFQSAPVGLDVQLAQLQGQLADCVNCDTARTPQGKAKIQELSIKIQSIRARLERVEQAKQIQAPTQTQEPSKALGNDSTPDPQARSSPLGRLFDASV